MEHKYAEKYELVELDKLIPYANNSRKHSKEQIKKLQSSLREYGAVNPIICDEDFNILCGHGRYMAAQAEGWTHFPCIIEEHLTPAQKKAYIIADNKLSDDSEWDYDMLKIELEALDEMDFDLDLTGFDDIELSDMNIFEDDEAEAVEDEGNIEIPEEPVAKVGDIYLLGNHRLMCGDSTKLTDVEKLMNGVKADLLITDPPYNVALGMGGSVDEARKRHRRTDGLVIMNDKMENDDFRKFLTTVFSNAKSVMKAGAAFYIWHADNESYNFRGALNDAGLQLRQTLIWKKQSITLGRQDYQWKHEPCLYGWAEGASHNWYSDRKQSTVLEFDRPTKSDIHPTMKPVALFDYQIKNSTKSGDICLDLFNGSGTTIMACEQNGRTAYCMELDPRYVDAAIKRWEDFTGRKAVKVN